MKKLLLETSFSKIYMIVMIITTLLILGGYFSYAMFTVSKEKSNAISIVTGNLTYKLEVDGKESNKLVVEPNSSKEFIVTLSNPNNRIARFNFYYVGNLPSGVDTGYIEEEGYNITPVETGINLEKDGTSGSSNTYIIRVSNITDEEITINLGVNVGLEYNDLSLPNDGHLFRKIINRGTVSEVIEDDIMNRLNYEDSEQTFVTGEEPYNYIWYSGKLWRVVSINPSDKSTKLVTQWNISAIPYNEEDNTNFEDSYMEEWLNDTTADGFLGNLRDYNNFIKTDSKWNATMMTDTTKPPKTTIVTDAVGLLNVYEYTMSYSGFSSSNGYLNNRLYWWCLTPYSNTEIYTTNIYGNNQFEDEAYPNGNHPFVSNGIRPSINLKASIKIVDGRGTKDNPYRLVGDDDSNLSGVLLNTRYSGEYIKFGNGENNLYRIVSHETDGLTKITSAEPLKENGNFKTIIFDINNNFDYSLSSEIGNFLNNDYLNPSESYLTNNQIEMIEESTTWYIGTVGLGENYKLAKYDNVNMETTTKSVITKIGLLRMGELMSGQINKAGNNESYWLLTRSDSKRIRTVHTDSNISNSWDTSIAPHGIKPVLNLKSNVIITSGDGTLQNPFQIALE